MFLISGPSNRQTPEKGAPTKVLIDGLQRIWPLRFLTASNRPTWAAVVALFFCFVTPNLMLLWIDSDRQHFIWALTSIALCASWMAAFVNVRRAVFWALPFFVLMPLVCVFIVEFKEFPSTNVVAVLVDTNRDEAWDFIEGRAQTILLSLLPLLAFWTLLVAVIIRSNTTRCVAKRLRSARILARAVLSALLVLIGLATMPAFSGIKAATGTSSIENSKELKALPFQLSRLAYVFPIGPIVSAADFYIGERNRAAWQAAKAGKHFEASLISSIADKRVYVLVIGESSRSDRWQLGSYGRSTNPRLSREPNVVFLQDVITPWTFTLASVPVITSRKRGTDHSRFFSEKSIISLFKEAGFRTYWISNQSKPAGIGSEIADISSEADESAWLNIAARDYQRETTYDGAVLGRLRATLAHNELRQFIVLHIMGSHDAYRSRYPKDFNLFRPSLTDAPLTDDHDLANRDAIRNTYDNTIAYTDYVLDEVIAILTSLHVEAGLLYASDHGESLFDGACNFVGHGGTAKENYSVSSLVWLSQAYVSAHPDALRNLRRNAYRRLSTENVFDSIAEMGGITFPSARPSRSILSEQLEETNRYVNVADTTVDWDQADFVGACGKPASRNTRSNSEDRAR